MGWMPTPTVAVETVTAAPVAALSATLNRVDPSPVSGDALPPLWHWLYFLPLHRHEDICTDGHPMRGGLLPPVSLPRRMWAGSRVQFERPIRIGDAVTRTSEVTAINEKSGRSGRLVFVTVRHTLSDDAGRLLSEEQDIVYRDLATPGAPAPTPKAAPADAMFSREIVPDEVMLFRYSALTFNSHRIHYDHPYATGVEGYPGLVVHGPLLATLLLDLLRREMPVADVTHFEFKALRPTFAGYLLSLCGRLDESGHAVDLWAHDHEGWLTMSARALIL
ncbi:MaoC family dehydratase N-terminal domain-containing protein [Caballeronia sp.]|uniref:FAS1-like dehydratase domain-containing protein n=1 Tax=Caballeronia sp. TaxID=1931223 RepID=UPI002638708E|nr:MaoC family dehydratase N-terminal domain-containing protein [Caballeronia sp.]